jgi:formylglycine-generating enzyme required for sulfatase activity
MKSDKLWFLSVTLIVYLFSCTQPGNVSTFCSVVKVTDNYTDANLIDIIKNYKGNSKLTDFEQIISDVNDFGNLDNIQIKLVIEPSIKNNAFHIFHKNKHYIISSEMFLNDSGISSKSEKEIRKYFILYHELGHVKYKHKASNMESECEADNFAGYKLAQQFQVEGVGVINSLSSFFSETDVLHGERNERLKRIKNGWNKFSDIIIPDPKQFDSIYETTIVPGGENFFFGSSGDKNAASDEKPSRKVERMPSFELGKYEVSNRLWEKYMGEKNLESAESHCMDCPVNSVSYLKIQEFIKKLNKATNKKYRLPKEDEWEYAATFKLSNAKILQFFDKKEFQKMWNTYNSHNVLKKNGESTIQNHNKNIDIYNLIGNVAEFCEGPFLNTNGTKNEYSQSYVPVRGGHVFYDSLSINSSLYYRLKSRDKIKKTEIYQGIGFRLVLEE